MAIKFTSDCEGTTYLSKAEGTGTTAAHILIDVTNGGTWSARVRVTTDEGTVLTTRSLSPTWSMRGALRIGIGWAIRNGYTDLTAEQRGLPVHIFSHDLDAAQA